MLPIRFCPDQPSGTSVTSPGQLISSGDKDLTQDLWICGLHIMEDAESLRKEQTRRKFIDAIKGKCNPVHYLPDPDLAELQPLEYCVLGIVWELYETPSTLSLLRAETDPLDYLFQVLPAAIVFQANLKSVRTFVKQW
jgi:hypothetical protein